MAIYIEIEKLSEDDDGAEYTFASTEGNGGTLRLNKRSGLTQLVMSKGDPEQRLYGRAAHKVRVAWEGGTCPDRLVWAS